MDTDAIIRILSEKRAELSAQGVEHLALFGSRVRGDYRVDSDLDVLLDVAASDTFSLLDLIGIEHTIADATGLQTNALLRGGLDGDFARTIADDVKQVF